MATSLIDVILRANTTDLEAGVGRATNALSGLGTAVLGLIGIGAGGAMLNNFVQGGIELNSVLETARLGTGTLITALADINNSQGEVIPTQEAYTEALKMSEEQLQKLRVAGLETAATSQQLSEAFQKAVGAGLSANMSLDDIRKTTIQITQAAGALGVPMNQINQEVTSILRGQIDNNSTVGKALNLSNDQIKNWKEQGTLVENLGKRMEAFSLAGQDMATTWESTKSNIEEATTSIAAVMTRGMMSELTNSSNSALSKLFDVNSANLLSDAITHIVETGEKGFTALGDTLGDGLRNGIQVLQDFDSWLATNEGNVTELGNSFGMIFDQVGLILTDITSIAAMVSGTTVESGGLATVMQSIALAIAAVHDGLVAVTGLAAEFIGTFVARSSESVELLLLPLTKIIEFFDKDLAEAITNSIDNVKQFGNEYSQLGADRVNSLVDGFGNVSGVVGELQNKFSEFDNSMKQLQETAKISMLDGTTKKELTDAVDKIEELRNKAKASPADFDTLTAEMRKVAQTALNQAEPIAAPFKAAKKELEDLTKTMKLGESSSADLTKALSSAGMRDEAIAKVVALNNAIASGSKEEQAGIREATALIQKELYIKNGLVKDVTLSSKAKATEDAEKQADSQQKIATDLVTKEIDLSNKLLAEKKKNLQTATTDRDNAAKEALNIEKKLQNDLLVVPTGQNQTATVFKDSADKIEELRRRNLTGVELESNLSVAAAQKIANSQALIEQAVQQRSMGQTAKSKESLVAAEAEAKAAEALSSRMQDNQSAINGVASAGTKIVSISQEQLLTEKAIEAQKGKDIEAANKQVASEEKRLETLKASLEEVKAKGADPIKINLVVSEAQAKLAGLKSELKDLQDQASKADGVTVAQTGNRDLTNTKIKIVDVTQVEAANKEIEATADAMMKNVATQATTLDNAAKQSATSLSELQKGMEVVAKTAPDVTLVAHTDVAISSVTSLDQAIQKILAYDGKSITIILNQQKTGGYQTGGMVLQGFDTGGALTNGTSGGHLPGFGGGDRRLILAEDGEFIINKDRTAQFFPLLDAINYASDTTVTDILAGMAASRGVGKFNTGGFLSNAINSPIERFNTGGLMSKLAMPSLNEGTTDSKKVDITLTIGGRKITGLQGSQEASDALAESLMNLQRSI